MKLEYIHSLLTLYKTGNMTRASEQLFISQQGLSKQIKVIEKSIGAALFVRTINGTTPTELCRKLYPAFKKIDEGYKDIIRVCVRKSEKRGLHFVVAQGLARYIDYAAINSIIHENNIGPFVLEEYPAEVCIEKLHSSEADIAFLAGQQTDSRLKCVPYEQLHAFAAMDRNHPLASYQDTIPVSALDGLRIVVPAKGTPIKAQLDRYFSEACVRPNYAAFIADNLSFLGSLHRSGLLAIVLDANTPKFSGPDLIFKYVSDPPFLVQINCCYITGTPRATLARQLVSGICANKVSAEMKC